ncbi:hypothetical protein [Limnoglobus roseus]|nr:hypothetical protein [Limnoglobus roseus]
MELPDRLATIASNGPTAIAHRLSELDTEWTTGRAVKATTGLLLVAGIFLAAFVDPWWLILPAVAGAALLQYMFFRRSWLTHIFSAAGLRSGAEIENERIALRVLRGDFQQLPTVFQVEDRDAVCRMEGEGGSCVGDECTKIDPRDAATMILEQTGGSKH